MGSKVDGDDTVLKEVKALAATVAAVIPKIDNLTSKTDDLTTKVDDLATRTDSLTTRTDDLTVHVRLMSATMSSLTRHVDRMDHRLQDVEQRTKLIPSITGAVSQASSDVDDHEVRLQKLEKITA